MSLFLEKVISDNIAQDGTLATDLTKVCSSFKLVVVVVCLWQYQINLITIRELWHSFVQKYNFFFLKIKAVWALRERIPEALMFCGTVYKVINMSGKHQYIFKIIAVTRYMGDYGNWYWL